MLISSDSRLLKGVDMDSLAREEAIKGESKVNRKYQVRVK
jgi:hypothetical protein